MAGRIHFERLVRWLRPRDGELERVRAGQAGADRLVASAEYELSRLRRDVEGVMTLPSPSERETTRKPS